MRKGNFEGERGSPLKSIGTFCRELLLAIKYKTLVRVFSYRAVQQTAEPIQMLFVARTPVGPRKHVLDRSIHWRSLVNTIEPPMYDGDAAFLSNYFDHLL